MQVELCEFLLGQRTLFGCPLFIICFKVLYCMIKCMDYMTVGAKICCLNVLTVFVDGVQPYKFSPQVHTIKRFSKSAYNMMNILCFAITASSFIRTILNTTHGKSFVCQIVCIHDSTQILCIIIHLRAKEGIRLEFCFDWFLFFCTSHKLDLFSQHALKKTTAFDLPPALECFSVLFCCTCRGQHP